MLRRIFEFTTDARGRVDFRLCYEAFRGLDPAKIEKGDRRHLAELQRELEAISVPTGELKEGEDLDLRHRQLGPNGGTVDLSQWAYEKLVAAVETAPFHAGLSLQVESLRERLSAAEKRESEAQAGPLEKAAARRSMKAV